MVLKKSKKDVTDQVVGKLNDGEIDLYLENEKIGSIKLKDTFDYELNSHFEVDQRKIYQHYTATEGPDARYTDCDEGGWC